MRLGNVIQASPSHPFAHAIPQYHQNNLVPFSQASTAQPTAPVYQFQSPYYPQHFPQQAPSSSFQLQGHGKPGYTLYNIAHHIPHHSQAYSPAPAYHQGGNYHPGTARSYVKHESPYTFERFGLADKIISGSHPFQQLNVGESLPQSNALVNLNFGATNEVYRTSRFARNPPQNATSYY